MSAEPTFPPPQLVSLAKRVFDLLRQRGEKVCVVETACGGLLSATLLSLPGASAIFAGSQTLYTLPSRITLADWTPAHIQQYSGPTPAIVEGLCVSLRTRLTVDPFAETDPQEPTPTPSDSSSAPGTLPRPTAARNRTEDAERLWAVGESGTAGPGRSGEGRNRTPGYVALAVVGPQGISEGAECHFDSADRVDNMVVFARAALGFLLRKLEEADARDGRRGSGLKYVM